MLDLLLQADPRTIWNAPNGSSTLWIEILITLVVGFVLVGACIAAPPRLRWPIIVAVTFLSGLFYVLYWLWPSPIDRSGPASQALAPRDFPEAVSFWLADAQPIVANLANTIAGFLLGLGVYSLLRVHLRKVVKQQRDWSFSLVLVICIFVMAIVGYWDWGIRQYPPGNTLSFAPSAQWGFIQYTKDLLFDGMLQQMDAVMFSTIAFFILSAAYRAFRARSVEATVLLLAALLMILSLLSVIDVGWSHAVNGLTGDNPNSFIGNFKLHEMSGWVKNTLQVSSIRGLDFGVGIGLLAMGLRLWLSLEKIGGEA